MTALVSLRRVKAAILVALAALLIFVSGMFVQNIQAQPEATADDLNGLLLAALHVDFVCSSRYTSHDRLAVSVPIIAYLLGVVPPPESGSVCLPYERMRVTLSLNFDLFSNYLSPQTE